MRRQKENQQMSTEVKIIRSTTFVRSLVKKNIYKSFRRTINFHFKAMESHADGNYRLKKFRAIFHWCLNFKGSTSVQATYLSQIKQNTFNTSLSLLMEFSEIKIKAGTFVLSDNLKCFCLPWRKNQLEQRREKTKARRSCRDSLTDLRVSFVWFPQENEARLHVYLHFSEVFKKNLSHLPKSVHEIVGSCVSRNTSNFDLFLELVWTAIEKRCKASNANT